PLDSLMDLVRLCSDPAIPLEHPAGRDTAMLIIQGTIRSIVRCKISISYFNNSRRGLAPASSSNSHRRNSQLSEGERQRHAEQQHRPHKHKYSRRTATPHDNCTNGPCSQGRTNSLSWRWSAPNHGCAAERDRTC